MGGTFLKGTWSKRKEPRSKRENEKGAGSLEKHKKGAKKKVKRSKGRKWKGATEKILEEARSVVV